MKLYSCILLGLLMFTSSCKEELKTSSSTSAVNGTVTDYSGISGELNIMGYFVEPFMSGSLDSDGTVHLDLPDNFDQITADAFTTYNKGGDATYELSAMSFSDMFINLDGLEVTGENAIIALAGKYYGYEVYKDGFKKGTVYPTTSLAYMEGIKKPEESNGTAGHHYIIIYLDQPISIKGEQVETNYINDDPERSYTTTIDYDLELNKGWNVYQHAIDDYQSDGNGSFFPTKQRFTTSSLEDIKSWKFLEL